MSSVAIPSGLENFNDANVQLYFRDTDHLDQIAQREQDEADMVAWIEQTQADYAARFPLATRFLSQSRADLLMVSEDEMAKLEKALTPSPKTLLAKLRKAGVRVRACRMGSYPSLLGYELIINGVEMISPTPCNGRSYLFENHRKAIAYAARILGIKIAA